MVDLAFRVLQQAQPVHITRCDASADGSLVTVHFRAGPFTPIHAIQVSPAWVGILTLGILMRLTYSQNLSCKVACAETQTNRDVVTHDGPGNSAFVGPSCPPRHPDWCLAWCTY